MSVLFTKIHHSLFNTTSRHGLSFDHPFSFNFKWYSLVSCYTSIIGQKVWLDLLPCLLLRIQLLVRLSWKSNGQYTYYRYFPFSYSYSKKNQTHKKQRCNRCTEKVKLNPMFYKWQFFQIAKTEYGPWMVLWAKCWSIPTCENARICNRENFLGWKPFASH